MLPVDPELFALFVVSVLTMQATPGPDTMLVISNALYGGVRRGVLCAVGFTAAGVIQIPLVVLGISEAIAASPLVFDGLRIAGGLYLIYVGARMLRAARRRPASDAAEAPQDESGWQVLRDGLINNLLNPKVMVFMVAFLPVFMDPARNAEIQLLTLAVGMKLCGLLVNSAYALFGGTALAAIGGGSAVTVQKLISGTVIALLGAGSIVFLAVEP